MALIALSMLLAATAEQISCPNREASCSSAGVSSHYSSKIGFDKPATLWGQDSIHMGIYPHLEGDLVRLSFAQAADEMTKRMITISRMDRTSTILDLGSGRGRACVQIAQHAGAACTGVDLTPENVRRSQELAVLHPELPLSFIQGCFLDLPPAVASRRFSHIFSIAALVHAHPDLLAVFRQVKAILRPGGVFVVSDFVGGLSPTAHTLKHWYGRAGVPCCLHNHSEWRRLADESGLTLQQYINLDSHQQLGYADLAEHAAAHDFQTVAGTPLADSYRWSAEAVARHEIGMNLALFSADPSLAEEDEPPSDTHGDACQPEDEGCSVVESLAPELEEKVSEEEATKRYYTKAAGKAGHTDRILGKDNIHTGYYPHLASGGQLVQLSLPQAADMLTQRMLELGRVHHNSSVLDLGSGKGRTCLLVASHSGAACTGLDLVAANTERSLELAASHPGLRLRYVQGSMTALPPAVRAERYSHVFAQLSTCYIPEQLPAMLTEARSLLVPGGLLVIADHLGGEGQFEGAVAPPRATRGWYDRLRMARPPRSHRAWRRLVQEQGFELLRYENLDRHMAQSYRDAADAASELKLVSQSGASVAQQYLEQVWSIERGHSGKMLMVLSDAR